MEKQPSFDKIIGGTEEQKEDLRKGTKEYSEESGKELFGEYLVEPNKNEIAVIKEAVEYANKTASYYGATRTTNPERVFLLKPDGVASLNEGKIRSGVSNIYSQSIAVDRTDSNALLAESVVHESFHMSCYYAAQIFEDGIDRLYRSGIEMRGREKEGKYFSIAQEAIIATLSRKFFDEVISKDPLYKDDMKYTEAIKSWLIAYAEKNTQGENKEKTVAAIHDILILPGSESVYRMLYETNEDDDYKSGVFYGYFKEELESGKVIQERSEERDKFNKVIDEIITNSKGKLNNKEKLFDEFAHAHFTGNYLPLARLIEGALGKGSFRKIATDLGEVKVDNE
jgi:hypothetical protein